MFGVRLSSATRGEMRQALHLQGMKLIRADARGGVDVYDANGVLNGATTFYLGYAASSNGPLLNMRLPISWTATTPH